MTTKFVSGMMTVRYAMRERELSIRQAIGAGRRRLMQGLLAIAVLLIVMAGISLDRIRATAMNDLGFDAEPRSTITSRRARRCQAVPSSVSAASAGNGHQWSSPTRSRHRRNFQSP